MPQARSELRLGGAEATGGPAATSLDSLVKALDTAVVDTIDGPEGSGDTPVTTVVLVDGGDLAAESEAPTPVPDVYLLVGVTDQEAVRWLDDVAARPPDRRPVAVMLKTTRGSAVVAAAHRAAVALLLVHPKARWNQILSLVERMLSRGQHRQQTDLADADLLAMDTDLFDLAQMVALNAGGLVSIEDAQSKVLAYSASDESADELRTLSIMGREGPREYLRALQEWGVFDRIRDSDDVVDVPAHAQLQTRRRLVVGIRDDTSAPLSGRLLGSIWLQEGDAPLSSDAAEVLQGASAMAARIISRSLNAPTTEGLLTQRLFGARGSGVDIPTVAAALALPSAGPAAVIAFAALSQDRGVIDVASAAHLIRLHASSFRRDAVVARIDNRVYVLLAQYKSARSVTAWARSIVDQFERKRSLVLRAAIALPIADLSAVATARAEVDRVLDATAATATEDRVTTLAESLTPVLLGEILDVVAADPRLADPRLGALDDYDRAHEGSLRDSALAYLRAYGDVRRAAQSVNVHPNTLRYRLRRVEEILAIDLTNHDDRMLLELQLAVRKRRGTTG